MLPSMLVQNNIDGKPFGKEEHDARRNALMLSLDAANLRYGRGTVKFGAEGLGKGVWALKQDHKSPSYTTCWEELAVAKC